MDKALGKRPMEGATNLQPNGEFSNNLSTSNLIPSLLPPSLAQDSASVLEMQAHFNPAFEGPKGVVVQNLEGVLNPNKHSAVIFKKNLPDKQPINPNNLSEVPPSLGLRSSYSTPKDRRSGVRDVSGQEEIEKLQLRFGEGEDVSNLQEVREFHYPNPLCLLEVFVKVVSFLLICSSCVWNDLAIYSIPLFSKDSGIRFVYLVLGQPFHIYFLLTI